MDPCLAWSVGCQMVCINAQTWDLGMRLERAKFALNGNCGYVLRPETDADADAAVEAAGPEASPAAPTRPRPPGGARLRWRPEMASVCVLRAQRHCTPATPRHPSGGGGGQGEEAQPLEAGCRGERDRARARVGRRAVVPRVGRAPVHPGPPR